jgi:lipopolysaccharide transport system ATP-binding protein
MVMRLAFSIAINSSPEILIVDEALSVGDAHFSAKCYKALKELKKKDLSIIYVSHDLNSLKLLCDRMILLNKGEIVKEGNSESVINEYNYLIALLNNQELNYQKNDFGNYLAKIVEARVYSKNSNSDIISSGDEAIIELKIEAFEDLDDVTVGILIKDKFGQDIFGTNSFYLNRKISLKRGKKYTIKFEGPLNLGVGKYFLTAAIHTGEDHLNSCLHWKEKAATFEVAGIKGEKFIGLVKLDLEFDIKESNV